MNNIKYLFAGLGLALLEVALSFAIIPFGGHIFFTLPVIILVNVSVLVIFFQLLKRKKPMNQALAFLFSYVFMITIVHLRLIPIDIVRAVYHVNSFGQMINHGAVAMVLAIGMIKVLRMQKSAVPEKQGAGMQKNWRVWFVLSLVINALLVLFMAADMVEDVHKRGVRTQATKQQALELLEKKELERKVETLERQNTQLRLQQKESSSQMNVQDKTAPQEELDVAQQRIAGTFLGTSSAQVGDVLGSLTITSIAPDIEAFPLTTDNIDVKFEGEVILTGRLLPFVHDGMGDCPEFELDDQAIASLFYIQHNGVRRICLHPEAAVMNAYEQTNGEDISVQVDSVSLAKGFRRYPYASARFIDVIK